MQHKIPIISEFRQAVTEGWVREFKHDTLPLVGFVYTFNCEMEGHWNNITRYARGIVFDTDGSLVAFPFPKFFNLNQHEETRIENLPNLPFTITTKEDGSLIIVFHYKGHWICSTKGSFHSEQANWANNYLSNMKEGWNALSAASLHLEREGTVSYENTYLFEGIYPANRIVVDYGDFDGLKFIGAFSRYFEKEVTDDVMPYISTFFPFAKPHYLSFQEIVDICSTSLKGVEQEGFVVRYSNGLRVKIKGEDYKSIHRIVTNATPLSVWESLAVSTSLNDIPSIKKDYLESIPDEFLPKILNWETELKSQYKSWLDCGKAALYDAQSVGNDRKSICIYLQQNCKDVISLAISIMDGKFDRVDVWIKNKIRPTANLLDSEQQNVILGIK